MTPKVRGVPVNQFGSVRLTPPQKGQYMWRFGAIAGSAMMVAAVLGVPATAHADDPDHGGGDRVLCGEQALKKAIKKTNDAGGGTLRLARRCTYSITTPDNEGNALPVITSKITIYGNGSTIRRSSTTAFRIFQVGTTEPARQGELTLYDVTIRNGRAVTRSVTQRGIGGGIYAAGSKLTLNGCKVVDNSAEEFGGGVAHIVIHNTTEDALTVRNSVISGNSAPSAGGVWQLDGIATYSHSTVSDNSAGFGGGLVVGGPSVVFNDTKITGNRARRGAGGLEIGKAENEGTFTSVDLNDTTVSNNTAVEAAGGISIDQSTVRLTRSRVYGNSATGANSVGGGISVTQNSLLTLRDSSVDNNSSQRAPGGIYNEDTFAVLLIYSRVVHNRPTNCSGSPTPVAGCVD
jgi:hypothetical protein